MEEESVKEESVVKEDLKAKETDHSIADEKAATPSAVSSMETVDVNDVYIRGRLTTLYTKPGFASLTVATGKTGRGEFEHSNYPDIICFKSLADRVAEQVTRMDYVEIKGRMYEHYLTAEEKEQHPNLKLQEVVATEVTKVPSYMEGMFGAPGNFFPPPECVVKLSGIIINAVSPAPSVVIITVAVRSGPRGRKEDRIRIQYYTRTPGQTIRKLLPGHVLACTGYIESRKTEGKDGTRMYYENLVARDIAIS